MKSQYQLIACVLSVLLSSFGYAGSPPDHSWRPFAANPPYGLTHEFDDAGEYEHSRWGVLMSQGEGTPALSYTKLTWADELFLDRDGIETIEPDFNIDAVATRDTGNMRIVINDTGLVVNPPPRYALFRKLHFQHDGDDYGLEAILGGEMNGDSRKAIILIHGWNPASDADSYDDAIDDAEFVALKNELRSALSNSPDWGLFVYHWEKDADTGPDPVSSPTKLFQAAVYGTRAAESGHLHGQYLGRLIQALSEQGIEKIHFIAHSAGAWVARAATKHLLNARSISGKPIMVQVTLLDPFIPGEVRFTDTNIRIHSSLDKAAMSGINELAGASSTSLYRIENYYTNDISLGTDSVFEWRGSDFDQNGLQVGEEVDTYGGHAGPIAYYTDTVSETLPFLTSEFARNRLVRAGLGLSSYLNGWQQSIHYNEPVVSPSSSRIDEVSGGGKRLAGSAHLRGDSTLATDILYRWEVSLAGKEGPWQPFKQEFDSSPFLYLSSAEVNAGKRWFRIVARNGAGFDTGDPVEIGSGNAVLPPVDPPASAPAAPTSLIATPVSSSQINLKWTDASNNETGFKLQRRLASSSNWTDIASVSANGQSFSNIAGLSPGTSYVYRVLAFNGTGSSGWSNEWTATTLLSQATSVPVTVTAVDDTGSSLIALNVSISTWTGVSDNYATNGTSGANGFTRQLPSGTVGWFSAPATLPDGRKFRYWLFGNSETAAQSTNFVASFPIRGPTTALANYAPADAPVRKPTALSIEGPSFLDEGTSATYRARAIYSDGTSAIVSDIDWEEDSSYASISSAGVLDAEAVGSDKAVDLNATYTAGGALITANKSVAIRNTVSTETYTLTVNAVNGHATPSPRGTSFPAGTVVSLTAYPDDDYIHTHWSGDAGGDDRTVTVRMDRNRTVTAHFALDTSTGAVKVNIEPAQAVAEGAEWKVIGKISSTNWQPSGDTFGGLKPGGYSIRLKDIPGWIAPDNIPVSIPGGPTTTVKATYREVLGSVQITILPQQAAQAGARWRLDGGAWQESGVTLSDISPGDHSIEFQGVSGWSTPLSKDITVGRGTVSVSAGEYGPPSGYPIINSVSPRTGPLDGGTTVTIDGANFQPGTSVTFNGVPATSVSVVSSAKVTAVSPPRASYGTVPLTISSGGNTITQPNGFAYLNPLGSNIELVGQIGGSFRCVDVQGNYAYVGEGASFVILDVSNPAVPVERGRHAMPGLVSGIVVVNGKAYVATTASGLYVLDVSNAGSPSILGFFDTPGEAWGVTLEGSVAYVADGGAGLCLIDVSNPTAPTLLSTLDTPGPGLRVAVSTIADKKYAFIADGDAGARIVDVTVPRAPTEISSIVPEDFIRINDLKVFGSTLYLAGPRTGIQIFDVSNPSQPILKGSYTNLTGDTLDVVGTRIYECSGNLHVLNASDPANPRLLGQLSVGNFPQQMRVAGGFAFIAFGREGFKIVAINDPTSLAVKTTINGIGRVNGVVISGDVAVTGNDEGGVDTVNVSNPGRPVPLAHIGNERVTHLAASGNTIALVNYGEPEVYIVDIAQPATPVFRSTYTATIGSDVAAYGGDLILAGATREAIAKPKVEVLSVANPSSPRSIGSLQISNSVGIAGGVSFAGRWAFVGRPNQALEVIDLVDVANPKLVGRVVISGYITATAASTDANYVYVADVDNGFHIVDARNKSAPAVVTTVDPSQSSFKGVGFVRVIGSRLYVADLSWVYVYDISQPESPVQIAYYDMPQVSNFGTSFDVIDDLIYVAAGEAGLSVLRVGDLDRPTVAITSPIANAVYSTTDESVSLSGTSMDLQGVTRVTWKNDRGGGGVAQGTTSWSISGVRLAAGINVLTVTAEDSQGNLAHDSISITATFAEADAPAVIITGPKTDLHFTYTGALLPLSGTAADVSGVESVSWTNDRGGSGSTVGTTNWSAEIPLFEGPNRITLTARDTIGNESRFEVIVTYLAPDAVAPAIGITFPTDQQQMMTTDARLNIAGEASDDQVIVRVMWENNRGGSGEATGGPLWYANQIVLQPGVNVLTVTAEDAGGNTAADTLVVTFSPEGVDPARPVVSVQTPAKMTSLTEQNHLTVFGQASGDNAIAEVITQLNSGPWIGAVGTNNWSADLTLTPGQNLIRFKSIDTTGRESHLAERVVTYRKLDALTITTSGKGAVTLMGGSSVTELEIGKLYTVKAKPAKGWVFAGWEGVVFSNSRRVSFVMEEDAVLEAVFVENPYEEMAASYCGLIRAKPPTHATSGIATVTLTKSGAFTAKFVIGKKVIRLKGSFDGSGSYVGKLKADRGVTYDLLLALDAASSDAPVTGLLANETVAMALNAWPTMKFYRTPGAPQAGGYTVAIQSDGSVETPTGYGTATIKVSETGKARMTGRLANGARISMASALTAGARVPVYSKMDGGRSSFSASLTFVDKPDSDLDGIGLWFSERSNSESYPFAPFTASSRVIAQRYTRPAKGERALAALDATNGVATATLDDGTTLLKQTLTFDTNNKLSLQSPLLPGFKMKLAPKTGEFKGSLVLPTSGKRVPFRGVLLEKSGIGVGVLLGRDAEMPFTLEPTNP